jgi:hypothetical protein
MPATLRHAEATPILAHVQTAKVTAPAGDALGLDARLLDALIHEHHTLRRPRLERLWGYYRNPMRTTGPDDRDADRQYHLAQEQGLPRRLRHSSSTLTSSFSGQSARQVVIENDIAWRIGTMVDFMFGQPFVLQSMAAEPGRADLLETFLRGVLDAAGGITFFQDLALLGAVYGFVDIALRLQPPHGAKPITASDDAHLPRVARGFHLELIDATRGIPVVSPDDYRELEGYIVHYRQTVNTVEPDSLLQRLRRRVRFQDAAPQRGQVQRTLVWTADAVSELRDGGRGQATTHRTANRLGRVPVVHIQNLPQPFSYEGLSEVEPLIPLQDELNIRLSDRANRVTFQSFKMYLGKGIEGFLDRPVGPGQMWHTDNLDASIAEFGGDGANPSEDAHIAELREAMDKASSVSPLAAGILRAKVGNLTSENALRIVLMGLLAKNEKKRITYGIGIARLCELILHAADVCGVLPNRPQERGIRLDWPSPLPQDQSQRLRDAKLKLELGVPQRQVLTELGYADCLDEIAASNP